MIEQINRKFPINCEVWRDIEARWRFIAEEPPRGVDRIIKKRNDHPDFNCEGYWLWGRHWGSLDCTHFFIYSDRRGYGGNHVKHRTL